MEPVLEAPVVSFNFYPLELLQMFRQGQADAHVKFFNEIRTVISTSPIDCRDCGTWYKATVPFQP